LGGIVPARWGWKAGAIGNRADFVTPKPMDVALFLILGFEFCLIESAGIQPKAIQFFKPIDQNTGQIFKKIASDHSMIADA